jgi:hypothetical protein
MGLNILGGPLEFDAQINMGTFDGQIKKMIQSILDVAEKAIASSKTQAEAITAIINAINPEGSPALQATIEKIKELQAEEKKFIDLVNTTQDPEQLKQYQANLEQIQKLLDAAPQQLQDQVEQEIIAYVEASIKSLNLATDGTISAATQLRAIKNELAVTDENDPKFQLLLEQAAQLEEKVKSVNKEVKQAAESTAGIGAAGQGLRGVVAGFEAYASVLSLTGTNSEKAEKATRQVIAAMGVLNSIEEIGKVLAKDSALNTFLLAQFRKSAAISTAAQAAATEELVVAEEAQVVATEGAAVAQAELNVAMAANPAGILLLAIGAIAAAITFFSSSASDAAEQQHKVNQAMLEAQDLMDQLAELYIQHYKDQTKAAETAISLAEAQGKSENEIFELRDKALKTKRQENIALLANKGIVETIGKSYKQQVDFLKDQLTVHKENLGNQN